MSKTARVFAAAGLALLVAASIEAKGIHEKARLLTRSIYVPVEFELCEHLQDAVLYQGEQAVSLLPVKRIFQFTYYPKLERIEPVTTEVRVEGVRENGEDFIGRLAVTPWGIFSANHNVELDLKKQLDRMRYRIDVRYRTVTLKLRCSDSCERKTPVRTAAGTVPQP